MNEPSASPQTGSSPSPRLKIEKGGLARIVFDDPERSANVLTEQVMTRLSEVISEVREGAQSGRIRGVLVESGKPTTFIVGADIEAIGAIESPDEGADAARLGQTILLALEQIPIPTLAAIHGPCFGGGTELALACRYRVASDHARTKIGLPEVQLGILPAWGGTTRLPRLIGLQASLDLLLTGKSVDGRKARRLGLVEEVLPHEIFSDAAATFLRKRIEEGDIPTGARRSLGTRFLDDTAPGRRIVLSMARRKVMEKTGGHYPAPLRILDVVKKSFGRSLDRAFALEAEAAGELLASGVSKNLVHVFQLREASRKGHGGVGKVDPFEVASLGVIGAGVMGGGVAQLAAYHGVDVRIKDIRHEAVSQALKHARDLFDRAVERRAMERRAAGRAMERIAGGIDDDGFGRLDLVVEAVVERLEVKRTVLRDTEQVVPRHCILTTNTSTLSVDAMAEALDHPERFCGMHFFNPVHKMPLIEVVRGAATSDRTIATVYAFALKLGKVPVVVGDGPGFLVNRILGPYLNEAGFLLGEGASVEDIDRAATRFGLPMGPLRLIDEVGIDVTRHAGTALHEAFGERMRPSDALVRLGETDRLGKKGGRGIYLYKNGRPDGVDPEIYTLLGGSGSRRKNAVSESDIRARLLLMMINEAARTLEDGIVPTAASVDLAMIMGTGFPPFRGGLLHFADDIHPRTLVGRLDGYAEVLGPRYEAAPLLRRLARADQGFYDAFPGMPE